MSQLEDETHIPDVDMDAVKDLQERLDYRFEEPGLLIRALTHRSYANEHDHTEEDNQRLEFLGDSVLGLVIAEVLFRRDEEAPEGMLSTRLSELVCESALVKQAKAIYLGEMLRLGRGEELTGGRQKPAVLADAYEAVLGAVYLDGGYEASRKMIEDQFSQMLEAVLSGKSARSVNASDDHKSALQREVQSRRPTRPVYEIIERSGPPHDRRFLAAVLVEEREVGRGKGRSKKEAEQAAAREAMAALEDSESQISRVLSGVAQD